jgi:hypothetical protein
VHQLVNKNFDCIKMHGTAVKKKMHSTEFKERCTHALKYTVQDHSPLEDAVMLSMQLAPQYVNAHLQPRCCPFNGTLKNSNQMAANNWTTINWKGCKRKRWWPNSVTARADYKITA